MSIRDRREFPFPAAIVQNNFTVGGLPQTIDFGPLSPQTPGDAPFSLAATAGSGLPVVFTVVPGPATLDGNILTLTGTGLVVIQATQAGGGNRTAAEATQAFTGKSTLALTKLSGAYKAGA